MWFLYAFYAVHETESLNPARGRVTVANNQLLYIQYVDPNIAFLSHAHCIKSCNSPSTWLLCLSTSGFL